MKKDLPYIRKEGIFKKIIKYLKGFFVVEKVIEQDVVEEDKAYIKENFINNLQTDGKDRILALQRKLKDKKIEISDLTDKELDEMIELYKKQIEEKDEKLKLYRKKFMKKQIKIEYEE